MRTKTIEACALAAIALAVACGTEGSTFDEKNPNGSSGTSGAPSSSGGFDTSKPLEELCVPYVVSKENDLYRFNVPKLTFTKIGRLDCPATGNPTSMAIDRTGTAWINYADGTLHKASTTDAKCTKTAFVPNQKGFLKFGMAFATNGADTKEESLFISGLVEPDGKGFGKIDVGTLAIEMLGDYSSSALAKRAAELTGTADGRVYGFFTTQPATLAQIDRANAATTNEQTLAGVSFGNAFALSFWGGDFWFYTAEGTTPSKVTQLKQASGKGEIVIAIPDVGGFRIVGAGVPTCAPLSPPR